MTFECANKSKRISDWKRRGVIVEYDDWEGLYEYYVNTDNCDICKEIFTKKNWRVLDHCHKTGAFRHILCHKCNVFDRWEKYDLILK